MSSTVSVVPDQSEATAASTTAGPATPRRKLAIAVGLGWGVRNYLLGETLDRLRERFDVSIFTPLSGLDRFGTRLGVPGVTIHPLEDPPRRGLRHHLFMLAQIAYWYRGRNASYVAWVRDFRKLLEHHATSAPRATRRLAARAYLGLYRALRWIGPPLFPAFLALYRGSLRIAPSTRRLRKAFRRQAVEGLFATNLICPVEWSAIIAARSLGLPVVGALASWDNPSSKSFPLCDIDGLIAWSSEMARQIQEHMTFVRPERVLVTGAPQFDLYLAPELRRDRASFFESLGLDPARKVVVHSTSSPLVKPDEPEIVRTVADIVRRLPGSPQLLVRLHPKDSLERYEDLRAELEGSGVAWTRAGAPCGRVRDNWCPEPDDIVRAVNTVFHGDVNVHCNYSSMLLDFSLLDKPVIVIAFDADGSCDRCRFYQTYAHLVPVVESGAIPAAYSEADLERHLRDALANPAARREPRRALVEMILGPTDGRAGKRTAEAVARIVEEGRARRRSTSSTGC